MMGLEGLKAKRAERLALGVRTLPSTPPPMDRAVKKSILSSRALTTTALGVIVLAVAGYGYLRFGLQQRASVDWNRLAISAVTTGTFNDYIPVTGAVEAETTVYLDVAQGGQVAERLVEEGATVVAGQPLVRFRNATLELQVASDNAQLAQSLFQLSSVGLQMENARLQHERDLSAVEADIKAVNLRLNRLRPLLNDGFAKRSDVEDEEANLAHDLRELATITAARDLDLRQREGQNQQLANALAQLDHNHKLAQQTLDDLTIRAPIGGQLTTLDAEIGASKTPGQRIGQIDVVGAFKVTGMIDEFYLSRVVPGQAASADIDGKTYRLTIAKIHPEVKNRQFSADLKFDGTPPSSIRRGQTVQLRLEIGSPSEGLVVANGAYFGDSGGQWVFVVNAAGDLASRRAVSFGRHNPLTVEVLSGLSAGERIVTSSTADFRTFDMLDISKGVPTAAKGPHS
jgi:HlyD family secretion protein